MFINKIGSSFVKPNFKGYQHVQDNFGNDVLRFNYPFDYENEKCEIQFFRVESSGKGKYKLIENPIATHEIQKGGTNIDIQSITDLDKEAPFAYRYVRRNKYTNEEIASGADTGLKVFNNGNETKFKLSPGISGHKEYSLVLRNATTPKVQGAGYLAFPDSQRVGYFYRGYDEENTGEIYLDKNVQKEMENTVRTFSNKFGGNLAGLEHNIDYLKSLGIKVFFANPIAGGDDKSSHHYWNKNNFQISDDMGNTENFNSFTRKLFQNGMTYVYDGTFTSEGLEGIHFQYAMRWADKKPQSYYWFRMSGLKDSNLGLGVVPKNKENLRFRLINSPKVWDETKGKPVENKNYDSNKETYIQIYDGSQVSDEQLSRLDKPIENYEKIRSGNPLAINSHDDTLINYICQVDPKEVNDRFDAFVDFNKNNPEPLKLNSPDGTILFSQFSNFRFDKKTEGGFVAWDANTDMVKMNYHISGYDEKINQAIVDRSERDFETKMQQRGTYEVQDMALQAGRYWTGKVKDIQTLYVAQVIKGAKTEEKLKELIQNGLLPEGAILNKEAIENIINGYYNFEPKCVMDKDSVTLRALMKLPLDSLEFAENTVGVLSTSYFSNRATTEETVGMTRFELLQNKNPHLTEEYEKLYIKTNNLYENELKNFADEIIKKVDETSVEKLLDENGDYTEYGEYVIELLAPSIIKYAMLKALTGENLKSKILPNGEITYDYRNIKEITTLKSLGINGVNPEDEANQLYRLIKKGLNKLDSADINMVAESISKTINGTNVNSFRLAEAAVKNAGQGLSWRLDAAKDVMDQDAVRNGDVHVEESWQNVIDFWKRFVQQVKKENPHSYIVAEITDMQQLMKATYGDQFHTYGDIPDVGSKYQSVPEALVKLFNETGITSEAAYSYFFTDLLKTFSAEFETGSFIDPNANRSTAFISKLHELIDTRGVDFTRNLFTFVGNHDKPRVIHGLSLDMGLFHANLGIFNKNGELKYDENRKHRIEAMLQLTNSDKYEDLPLEAKLNVDNPEYFNTVSTKAVAMSQILRQAINETLPEFATSDEIKYLKEALVDLTNGNFLGLGSNVEIQSIDIKELSSLKDALTYLVQEAGIHLSETEFNQILAKANESWLIDKYRIQGDFDWDGNNSYIGETNRNNIETILRGDNPDVSSGEWDYKKYSLYTTAIAGILREAFLAVKGNDNSAKSKFFIAEKNFVKKFDRETVEAKRIALPFQESSARAMAKDGFASLDIQTSVEMLIRQAEYRAREDKTLGENEHFQNAEKILTDVYQNATEPGIQKAIIMYSFLSALIGIPTIFGGDELGMTGWEDKAKNSHLQDRNALPWSQLEDGPFKNFCNKVLKEMSDSIKIRSREGVDALNNGTPYRLVTSDDDIPAFLMQDSYGNMTISIFNATGIAPENRFDYFKQLGLNDSNREEFFKRNNIESINPENSFVPIQGSKELEYIALGVGLSLPAGLIFMNSDTRDNSIYEIKKDYEVKIKGKIKTIPYAIIRKGEKIALDSLTAKNGVMVLKHVNRTAKHFAFRGNSPVINRKYVITSNLYQKTEIPQNGKCLSLILK